MNENDSLNTLLVDAARRGIAYRQSCGDRAVAPSDAAVAAVQRLVEPLSEEGRPDEEVLALLDEIGSPATMAMAGPRFFGFVIGGSLPVTVATNWLSTAWDQNVVMHEVTPATATIEKVAIDWMVDLFGFPAGTGAGFTSALTISCCITLAAFVASFFIAQRTGD